MFQIINVSNLLNPFNEAFGKFEISDKYRGWDKYTFVTGQFLSAVLNSYVRILSVNNIANMYCPTGRDLYIQKGLNRPANVRRSGKDNFQRRAGIVGENFFTELIKNKSFNTYDSYEDLKKAGDSFIDSYETNHHQELNELRQKSDDDYGIFMAGLRSSSKMEIGIQVLLSILQKNKIIDSKDVLLNQSYNPNKMLGISSHSAPDFVIPKLKLIGDVKSGEKLEKKHLLTCAGYALAYENSQNTPIDWGMIYFFKARNYTDYGKQISLPQVYLLPIDDDLRQYFLDVRNELYAKITKDTIPKFPNQNERTKCNDCNYVDFCKGKGLVI